MANQTEIMYGKEIYNEYDIMPSKVRLEIFLSL